MKLTVSLVISPIISLASMASLVFLCLSCAKPAPEDKKSVDEDGNCTPQLIQSYNTVIDETTNLKKSLSADPADEQNIVERAKLLRRYCKAFFTDHKDINCKAQDFKTDVAMQIQSKDLTPNCSPATQVLKNKS